jgi:hypothetical protein
MTGRTYPPTTEEANFFRTFIGTALRQAWEAFDWPEQTITQQEFFAPTYSALESYSFGDVVYWPTEQKYYQWINDASSSGEPPTFDADYFFVLGLEDGVTALGLENGESIEVIPPVGTTSGGTLNSTYWAEAHPSYSSSSNASWDSNTAYEVGDIVLYEVTQQYYQCFSSALAGTEPTNNQFWGLLNPFFRHVSQIDNPDGTTRSQELGEIFAVYRNDPRVRIPQTRNVQYGFDEDGLLVLDEIPYVFIEVRLLPPVYLTDPTSIPYRFSEICSYRAAGQMLRVDGKVDLGNEFLQLGESALTDEIDKVARQEMQVRQIVVPTR